MKNAIRKYHGDYGMGCVMTSLAGMLVIIKYKMSDSSQHQNFLLHNFHQQNFEILSVDNLNLAHIP